MSAMSFPLVSALFAALAASTPIPSTPLAPRSVWQPSVGCSWDITLSQEVSVSSTPILPNDVAVIDMDLFTNTGNSFDSPDDSKIKALHAANKKVICYFSAGSYEPSRPDSSRFTAEDKGAELDGWPGEYWLNLKSENVANIMRDRIALAAKVGCDAVDPDNMDGYDNTNGIGLTSQDAINFMKNVLSPAATSKGLAIGLKNSASIIPDVLDVTHFSVNEQCAQYNECEEYAPYIAAGKPVFQIEYPAGDSSTPKVLSVSATPPYCVKDGSGTDLTKFSTVLKKMNLDDWTQVCSGQVVDSDGSEGGNSGNGNGDVGNGKGNSTTPITTPSGTPVATPTVLPTSKPSSSDSDDSPAATSTGEPDDSPVPTPTSGSDDDAPTSVATPRPTGPPSNGDADDSGDDNEDSGDGKNEDDDKSGHGKHSHRHRYHHEDS